MNMAFRLDNLQYLIVLNQQICFIDYKPKISHTGKTIRVYGGNEIY
jgi:hypothetical protein